MSEFKSTSPALLLCSALLLSASTLASTAFAAGEADPQLQDATPSTATDIAPADDIMPAPAATPRKNPAGEAALPQAQPDYYAERAKKLVGAESNSKIREHALQKQFPDQNVVVCEAGCPSGKSDQIMFMEPKAARKSQKSAEMIPSAGGPGAAAALDITCEAGCYDTMPKSYHSLPGAAVNTALKGAASGNSAANSTSWVTTVARADDAAAQKPKTAAASGDWMKRIDQQAMKPAEVAKVESPAAAVLSEAVEPKTQVETVAAADVKAPATSAELAAAPGDVPVIETAPAKPDAVATAEPIAPVPDATVTPSAPAVAMETPATSVEAPAVAPDATADAVKPVVDTGPAIEAAPVAEPEIAAAPTPAAELAPAAPAVEIPAPLNAPASETPSATAESTAPAAPAEDAAVTAQNDVIDEGGDLKQAGEMAKALDQAKATAEKAEAISEAAPAAIANAEPAAVAPAPVMSEPSAPAAATAPAVDAEAPPTFPPEQPKIVSGPAPDTMTADKPVEVAEITPDQAPSSTPAAHSDAVINVETGDPDMNAAISKARLTLPEFWSKLDAPASGETDFSLKVAIEGANKGEVEHFWLTNIMRKDGKIVGIISNDPETVKTVTRGQSYEINPEKISDWLYKRNGKMVGNETMRPLLKRLPPQQAAAYRSMYETP